MKTISIQFAWSIYLKLRDEGAKLRDEGAKLRDEGAKLWDEGAKLRDEGAKLWDEGAKLWDEGAKLWDEGVIEAYGNVTIEWKSSTHCIVDGTDEYKEGK